MSGLMGGSGEGYYQARRGMEKLVFYSTIVLSVIFVALAVYQLVHPGALTVRTTFYMWFKKIFAALTKKERITFVLALAGTVVSFAVVMGCRDRGNDERGPRTGGAYTEGMLGQPEYVNPVIASSQTDLDLVKMVYSNLSDISDSITPSADLKTWDVRLKQGLTWQDGQQLTSDDVIFTVQSIQNPDARLSRSTRAGRA